MSMKESVKRLQNSRIEPDYFWWEGKDFLPILEEIEEVGAENAVVKAHLGLDENGSPDLHFVVEHKTTKDCGEPLNHSHVCPPWC